VAEVRAERTADFEQVADAGFYVVAEALDEAALKSTPSLGEPLTAPSNESSVSTD
jgi:hypothetical protein